MYYISNFWIFFPLVYLAFLQKYIIYYHSTVHHLPVELHSLSHNFKRQGDLKMKILFFIYLLVYVIPNPYAVI